MPEPKSNGIYVQIMGQKHQFSCPREQEPDLLKAAQALDDLFWETKKTTGTNERTLLMVALNLSYQLLSANNQAEVGDKKLKNMIESLTLSLKNSDTETC